MNITLENINGHIRVNRHRLDEELELQGEFAFWIGRKVAQLDSKVESLADELKRTEARLNADARDRLDKPTEKEIDAWVRRRPDRIRAFEVLQIAKVEQGEWLAAQEGWKQRSYSLKGLATLYSSDYWAQRSTSITGPKDDAVYGRELLRQASADRAEKRSAERSGFVEQPTPVSRVRVG